MLPENDDDAANLLALSIILAGLTSIITVPVIWFGGDILRNFLKAPDLGLYLWLVPPAVFLSGVFMALNYWNSRTKRFGRLSVARVGASIVTTGTQLGAGFAGYATSGSLVASSLMGSAASTIMLGGQIWRDDGRIIKERIKMQHIVACLIRFKKFPLYDTWSALLNSISSSLPTFLLSIFFSTIVVGYYALAMMVLQLPLSLISQAVSQVFFQRASVAKHDGSLSIVVMNTIQSLIIIGAYPFLVLSPIAKEVFLVIFGSNWVETGFYVQILSFWIFFVFITTPVSSLFSVLERQRAYLLFNIILFFLRAAALIIGGLLGDPRIALILFSSVGVVAWAFICLWLLKNAGIHIHMFSKNLLPYFFYLIPALGLILLAKYVFQASPQMILLSGIFISIAFYTICFRTYLTDIIDILKYTNLRK